MKGNLKVAPIRGTQTLVDQMGWVFRRPSITALEVGWRWLFGVPFLLVCLRSVQHITVALPPESAGLTNIDAQNPWIAAGQLSSAWWQYEPLITRELRWIAPVATIAWVILSALGRSFVLKRIEPRVGFRPMAMVLLQAAWLALFVATWWCWLRSIGWAAATHIAGVSEPDLVGFAMWAIFLSLGFFTLWALIGWTVSVAPLLAVMERRSAGSALVQSLRLGNSFSGKLVEIGLVMGIVNLALIVVAMVLSAAPLPFSDQLGGDAMHVVWAGAALCYLVASDYFQVVRIKSYVEFWKTYRGLNVLDGTVKQ